jgi:hypothetical protein
MFEVWANARIGPWISLCRSAKCCGFNAKRPLHSGLSLPSNCFLATQAATASTAADSSTGIDFDVGVPAPSAIDSSGTSGFVSG